MNGENVPRMFNSFLRNRHCNRQPWILRNRRQHPPLQHDNPTNEYHCATMENSSMQKTQSCHIFFSPSNNKVELVLLFCCISSVKSAKSKLKSQFLFVPLPCHIVWQVHFAQWQIPLKQICCCKKKNRISSSDFKYKIYCFPYDTTPHGSQLAKWNCNNMHAYFMTFSLFKTTKSH